ncbi:MAG: HAD family hydrolase [Pedobacter sp.]|nr:MAG: HAD family hydrolase [Pedobacter sp.]
MMFYKHYSFDLWLTLIKSNPAFKVERTNYFHQHFNRFNKSREEVAQVFRQVDLMVNAINEKTGKNIDADEMYLLVISIINDYTTDIQDVDVNHLYTEMEQLLMDNLPVLYCPECPEVLYELKASSLSSVSLLSNTGFIKGRTLRHVLRELKIDAYLDFQLYSDEVRLSKPNPAFFKLMLDSIDRSLHPALALHEVIHIGDNPHADKQGAEAVGIHSLLINSNDLSITHLRS